MLAINMSILNVMVASAVSYTTTKSALRKKRLDKTMVFAT